jgi:hypothetical protein
MPNIGQIVEIDPVRMNPDQAATTTAVVTIEPGNQFGSSSLRANLPPNLLTEIWRRVSRVDRRQDEERLEHDREVYQYFISPLMPGIPSKIFAMPSASVTAPPVRPRTFLLIRLPAIEFLRLQIEIGAALQLNHANVGGLCASVF